MVKMVKVGLIGAEGLTWDEGGKSSIRQIYISHQQDCIKSIQFLYDVDGKHVLSNTFGGFGKHTDLKFKTVSIDPLHEPLISISGEYINRKLVSIAFHTNKKKYGPFGRTVDRVSIPPTFEEFKYDFGTMCVCGGFHGTISKFNDYVTSIGVYVKPKLTNHKTEIGSSRNRW